MVHYYKIIFRNFNPDGKTSKKKESCTICFLNRKYVSTGITCSAFVGNNVSFLELYMLSHLSIET